MKGASLAFRGLRFIMVRMTANDPLWPDQFFVRFDHLTGSAHDDPERDTASDQFYVDYAEQLSAGTLTRRFDRAVGTRSPASPRTSCSRASAMTSPSASGRA